MTSPTSPPLVHHQPFRFFYQLTKVLYLVVRIPVWLTIALFPPLRPHRSWTFLQTVMTKVLRAVVDTMHGSVGQGADRPIDKDQEGKIAVVPVIESFSPDVYVGPLVSDSVVPEAIHGNAWVPGIPGSIAEKPKVVMHVHGGAFVLDLPLASPTGFLAKTLVEHAKVDAIFAVRYRLSAYGGKNPFPAALQDVLTSYLYLVRTLRVDPAGITVSGDSAGGNLVIGLLRYLEEHGAALGIPKPGRAFLVAPWVAPGHSFQPVPMPSASASASAPGQLEHRAASLDSHPRSRTDYLPASFLQFGATVYSPRGGVDDGRKDPYITPLGHPFRTSVPVLVSVGSLEILESDVTAWVEEMRAYRQGAGEGAAALEMYYEEGAPHDTLLCGGSLGFDASAVKVASKLGEFIEKTRS